MTTVIRMTLALAFVLSVPQTGVARWSDWLSKREFEQEFRYQASRGRYPREVSASIIDDEVLYRGDFIRTPSGRFRWASHHGVSNRRFEEYKDVYEDEGYELIWHGRIRHDGRTYNQGVWIED